MNIAPSPVMSERLSWKNAALIERWSTHGKIISHEAWLASYSAFRGTVVGHHNRCILIAVTDGRATFYYDDNDMAASADVGLAFFTQPSLVDEYIARSKSANDQLRDHCTALSQRVLSDCQGEELAWWLRRFFELHVNALAFYKVSAEEFCASTEMSLAKAIQQRGGDAATLLPVLLRPDASASGTSLERSDWLELLRAAMETGANPDAVAELLKTHANEHAYLGAAGGNPRGWTEEFFRDRYLAAASAGLDEEIRRIEGQIKGVAQAISERQHHEKGLKIDAAMTDCLGAVRRSTLQRMEIREEFTRAAYLTNPLFQEIYKRVRSDAATSDLGNEVLRQIRLGEMLSYLDGSRSLEPGTLIARYANSVFGFDENGPFELTETAAVDQAKRTITGDTGFDDTLRGSVAHSAGIVTGIARVIDSGQHTSIKLQQAAQMQQGEILVTGMTHPNIIAACEKAAAIVTDQGGVTCHAAIVARELGIPCVIGTRFATKVLQTGDQIRVDTNTGVVSKV